MATSSASSRSSSECPRNNQIKMAGHPPLGTTQHQSAAPSAAATTATAGGSPGPQGDQQELPTPFDPTSDALPAPNHGESDLEAAAAGNPASRLSMDAFRRELLDALAESPVDAAVVDQMLNVVERVKSEILHDIRREHGALQKKLEEKITVLSSLMQQVHICVLRSAIDAKTKESDGISKKRKAPDP